MHEHVSDPSDEVGTDDPRDPRASTPKRSRRPRRARLEAPAGTDPEPYDPPVAPREPEENDARLREDVPPHWG